MLHISHFLLVLHQFDQVNQPQELRRGDAHRHARLDQRQRAEGDRRQEVVGVQQQQAHSRRRDAHHIFVDDHVVVDEGEDDEGDEEEADQAEAGAVHPGVLLWIAAKEPAQSHVDCLLADHHVDNVVEEEADSVKKRR